MLSLSRLNSYRIMWVFVYFDLPTTTKKDRKEYTKFKDRLEKDGFMMLQYSVYIRHCTSRENAEMHKKRVKSVLPPMGHIIVHFITDKQFGMMEVYFNTKKQKKTEKTQEKYTQLTIF